MRADLPVSGVVLEDLRRQHRRVRFVRFIVCEMIAILILVATVVAGLSARFAAESYTPVFRILPIIVAIVAAIIPVLFYGNPKRRNRGRPLR